MEIKQILEGNASDESDFQMCEETKITENLMNYVEETRTEELASNSDKEDNDRLPLSTFVESHQTNLWHYKRDAFLLHLQILEVPLLSAGSEI